MYNNSVALRFFNKTQTQKKQRKEQDITPTIRQ